MIKNNRPIEYKMTKTAFQELLKTRPAEDKSNPYSYVMKVLNDNYGLRGTVKKIVLM